MSKYFPLFCQLLIAGVTKTGDRRERHLKCFFKFTIQRSIKFVIYTKFEMVASFRLGVTILQKGFMNTNTDVRAHIISMLNRIS